MKAQLLFEDNQSSLMDGDGVFGTGDIGSSVSFFDFDNDGWDDITIAASTTRDFQFFKNQNGSFTAIDLGITSNGLEAIQAIWVDYDNDGDADFFATSEQGQQCWLYRNDESAGFTDITVTSGIAQESVNYWGGSWGDIDNDGFLDVFLSVRDLGQEQPNMLYHNNGDGTFTNISESAGISPTGFISFCSSFFDYDNDGDQDIYVANDKDVTPNNLYRNNGNGTFTDTSIATNSNLYMGAMSTAIDDYNNDGWLDIYVTNLYPPFDPDAVMGNAFLENNEGTFSNIAGSNGTRFDSIGWGAVFLDADNDGDKDLYVSGSTMGTQGMLSSAFYENNGLGDFTIPNNIGLEDDVKRSYSNAIGDVQNDGYPDIIVLNLNNDPIFLWENKTTSANNWIKVELEGTESNRMGIGSKIKVIVGDDVQYGYTLCGEGYIAQNSQREFFGVGDASTVDAIEVQWLSGQVDRIEDVAINQTIKVIEGQNPLSLEEETLTNFQLYPNPVENEFQLDVNQEFIRGTMSIYDLQGKLILEQTLLDRSNLISVSSLQTGLYMLKIKKVNHEITLKFVKK